MIEKTRIDAAVVEATELLFSRLSEQNTELPISFWSDLRQSVSTAVYGTMMYEPAFGLIMPVDPGQHMYCVAPPGHRGHLPEYKCSTCSRTFCGIHYNRGATCPKCGGSL